MTLLEAAVEFEKGLNGLDYDPLFQDDRDNQKSIDLKVAWSDHDRDKEDPMLCEAVRMIMGAVTISDHVAAVRVLRAFLELPEFCW